MTRMPEISPEYVEVTHKAAKKMKKHAVYGADYGDFFVEIIEKDTKVQLLAFILGPIFYFKKHSFLWACISLLLLIGLLDTLSAAFFILYVISLTFARSKVMNAAYRRSKERPLLHNNVIIYATADQKKLISQLGFDEFLKSEVARRAVAVKARAEERKKARIDRENDEAEAKRQEFSKNKAKLISILQEKYQKSTKTIKYALKFEGGTGFDVYPSQVQLSIDIINSAYLKPLDHAKHAKDQQAIDRISVPSNLTTNENEWEFHEPQKTFMIELDERKFYLGNITSVHKTESKEIHKRRKEKIELVTSGATIGNLINLGNHNLDYTRSVTKIEQTATPEEGQVNATIDITLDNGMSFQLSKSFSYKGHNFYDRYELFEKLCVCIERNLERRPSD
jgi:hypothetical protein